MRVLVIGSGGREHALCWKLRQQHPEIELYCAPCNGGISEYATIVPITVDAIDQLVGFAQDQHIDLTVVGPELPLSLGIVDSFQAAGLAIFGPTRLAAEIESSKAFAKDFMQRNSIPTADFRIFNDAAAAVQYIATCTLPVVVKADGLAAGKGVVVCHDRVQAQQAVIECMQKHKKVVIEEFLEGEEFSLMAFVDGTAVLPLIAAQDHKAVYDGDQGPNTGGMGAYAPLPHFSASVIDYAVENILQPTAIALCKEGRPFTGILYAGLMLTSSGVKVIEFNARFGDPETQVILPCLESDLLSLFQACVEHRLVDVGELIWNQQVAVGVVLAAQGYPGAYATGQVIGGIENAIKQGALVFHAGTKKIDNQFVSAGGRVLNIVGTGPGLITARNCVYEAVAAVQFEGMHYRRDIAAKALAKMVQKDIAN